MSSDQAAPSPQRRVFRLPGALVAWWGWVLFAAANLVDLAIQGRGHTAADVVLVLVVVTGLVYACALRPRIVTDASAITVMNPLRDHRVPWGSVTGVDLRESVQVHYAPEDGAGREKVIHSWALYARRHSRLRSELIRQGATRRLPRSVVGSYGAAPVGYSVPRQPPGGPDPVAKQSAAQIMTVQLDQLARDARQRGAAGGPRLVRWAWEPIAAIAVPAVALALVLALVR